MIKIENTQVLGWEPAIRGMRNPKNSWARTDSKYCGEIKHCELCEEFDTKEEVCTMSERYHEKDIETDGFVIGPNDHGLMMNLAAGGPVHAKYRRMIAVYVDITAPLYWWKEFDTYKIGTVTNSCSTMHKIHDKEFTREDFSCDKLMDNDYIHEPDDSLVTLPMHVLDITISTMNYYREKFIETKDKKYWEQLIQLLPSSYNQKRTIMLNYEVLAGIYPMRKNHKLDEWHVFCDWIKSLPYSEIIVGPEFLEKTVNIPEK